MVYLKYYESQEEYYYEIDRDEYISLIEDQVSWNRKEEIIMIEEILKKNMNLFYKNIIIL